MIGGAPALDAFISYSHQDEAYRLELNKHLAMLKRQGILREWDDRMLVAGVPWDAAISRQLATADLILLLVSPDFMVSDYCWSNELQMAMDRHRRGDARVIPIVLRPVDWSGAPFAQLQALPRDARPISTWSDRDEAFVEVVRGIRRACADLIPLQQRRVSSVPPLPDQGRDRSVAAAGKLTMQVNPEQQGARANAIPPDALPSEERTNSNHTELGATAHKTGSRFRAGAVGIALAALIGCVFWSTHFRIHQRPPASIVPAPPLRNPSKTNFTHDVANGKSSSALPPPAVQKVELTIVTEPQTASISLDDRPAAQGRLHALLSRDPAIHTIRAWAPGYKEKMLSFAGTDTPSSRITLDRIEAPSVIRRHSTSAAHHSLAPAGPPPIEANDVADHIAATCSSLRGQAFSGRVEATVDVQGKVTEATVVVQGKSGTRKRRECIEAALKAVRNVGRSTTFAIPVNLPPSPDCSCEDDDRVCTVRCSY